MKYTITKDIIIKEINTAIIDGNTYYYLTDSENNRYRVSIKVNSNLIPFIKIDDTLTVRYRESNDIMEIIEINTK